MLMFNDGETNGSFILTIIDDDMPELDTLIQIQISTVSEGEVGDMNTGK